MPKRDAAYLTGQRDMIARAAFECILENGVAATSMRTVAMRAGVTTGAVYIHFESRDDLIVAAALSEPFLQFDPVDNWADYAQLIRSHVEETHENERVRSGTRAMYEFVAGFHLGEQSTPIIDRHLQTVQRFFRESLTAMHDRGEIALPLGLETTVLLHLQLLSGATYSLFTMPFASMAQIRDALVMGLEKTAGK